MKAFHIYFLQAVWTNGSSQVADTARGLAYLHGLSPPVCHCDIKSVRIMPGSILSQQLIATI